MFATLNKKLNKIVCIAFAVVMLFVGVLSVRNASAEGIDSATPSATRDIKKPDVIEQVAEDGNEYEGIVVKSTSEVGVMYVTVVSYAEAQEDKYKNAPENTVEGIVFKNLEGAYEDVKDKPARALNSGLTNELARELGGNDSYDASNFIISYMFDMEVSQNFVDQVYAKPENYLKIVFDLHVTGDHAPIFLFKCNEEDGWEILEDTELNEDGSVTVKFYTLCPILIIETTDAPKESTDHPEWAIDYPLSEEEGGCNSWCWWILLIIVIIILLITYIYIRRLRKSRDDKKKENSKK